jgi:DNA-binding transcriptional regulator PaaX
VNPNEWNVAVVDGKTIPESVELRTTKQGEPVRIKAVKDGSYMLTEGGDKLVAPENLTIKRAGNDTEFKWIQILSESAYTNRRNRLHPNECFQYCDG